MSDCGRTGGMDTNLAVLNVVEPGSHLHVWGCTRHASSSTRSFSRGLPTPNPVSDPTAPARIGLAVQAVAQWPLLVVVAASKPTLLAPVREHYQLVQDLLDRGLEVWGLDAAPGMIEQCRERFGKTSRAHFVLGEATKLSFPDGFFDALISIGVLDRIQSCDLALAEMARVVKRGGTFLVSFPNLLSPYAVWKNFVFYPIVGLLRHAYYGLARRPIPQGPPLSFASLRTRRAAARLMAGHKVQVAEAVYFHFNLFLSPLDDLIRPLAVKVTGRFEGLRFGRMRWLGVGFLLKARK